MVLIIIFVKEFLLLLSLVVYQVVILELVASIQIVHLAEDLHVEGEQAKDVQEEELLQGILGVLIDWKSIKRISHKMSCQDQENQHPDH